MKNGKKLSGMSWNDYQVLSLEQKAIYYRDPIYHTLIAQQFSRKQLERLCSLATRIRMLAKRREGACFLGTLLNDKRVMLYFAQPSTRTYLSFLSACEILGLKTMDVRDTATSSEVKGESPEDTVRTFSSYADMIIMRHPVGGFAERIAWMLSNTDRPVPVVNAGSGADQHPTQALLDIYTLERSFEKLGGIDGKTIACVGDLKRGRTVRSLAWLLTLYRDVKIRFVAPEGLQIGKDILELLDSAGTEYSVTSDFTNILPQADAIYMTRIQDEWDVDGESRTIDHSAYCIDEQNIDKLKKTAVIMHPLPRRNEINPSIDSDPRAVFWRQVRNGMWIRVALILISFERDHLIDEYEKTL